MVKRAMVQTGTRQLDFRCRSRVGIVCSIVLVVVLGVWSLGAPRLLAQQVQPAADAPEPNTAESSKAENGQRDDAKNVRFVGPDTFILLDEQGHPQPFPGMKYEDFMNAWKQLNRPSQGDARLPRYSIERLTIEGRTQGSHARLQISLQVLLLTDEVVQIPIRMARAIVESYSIAESETGENYLAYDEASRGLTAWMRGEQGERSELKLNVLVPLHQEGSETAIRLACPRAVTSTMSVAVPGPVFDKSVTGEAELGEHARPDGTTVLDVTGLAGELELRWRTEPPEAQDLASVLRANGRVRAQIDGHSLRMDAQLTVQSFGSGFDQFYVRLPPGAAFLPGDQGGADVPEAAYSLEQLEPGQAPPGADTRSPGDWVLVKLAQRQRGPVEVNLATEQPLRLEANNNLAAKLGGFEVLGAVRQFGDVVLMVDDEWQLRWELGEHVRQVDVSDLAESVSDESVEAAFRYDLQPWSLDVRVVPRSSRVQVTPKYQLRLLADEARLRAEFEYFVSGARTVEFQLDMRGWRDLDSVNDSSELIDTPLMTEDGKLLLRLKQAAPRNYQLVVEARRDLPAAADQLQLPLPAPLADVVGSGELVVLSPPNLALTPERSRMAGLTPELARAASEPLADVSPGYQVLNYRTFLPDPTFSTGRAIRSREIVADVKSRLQVGETGGRVDQLFQYQVYYQPVQRLEFQVPEALFDSSSSLQAELVKGTNQAEDREQPVLLNLVEVADPADSSGDSQQRLVQLTLPRPELGRFAVRLQYRFAAESPQQSIEVPLVVPLDGVQGFHEATVTTSPGLVASIAEADDEETSWRVDPLPPGNHDASLGAVASNRATSIPLEIHDVEPAAPPTTTISRAWVQAWLAPEVLQQRAVYQFETNESSVSVELPAGVAADSVDVMLDGTRVPVRSRQAGPLSIPVPSSNKDRLHTLEILYQQPAAERWWSRLSITPPLLAAAQPSDQSYWQIILPGDTLLLRQPNHLVAAATWGWLGTHFGQRPIHDQAELERWSGAGSRLEPAPGENEYLFSSLDRVSSLAVVTARRWLIVLVVSAATLALGLLLVYVPPLRRWDVLAIAIAIVTIAFPGNSLLLAQAAGLGVLLILLALVLRQSAVPDRDRSWTPHGSTATVRTPAGFEKPTPTPLATAASGANSSSVRTADSRS